MEDSFGEVIWRQFGAAIDTLENAITACPEELWAAPMKPPDYWRFAFHTLFWLDFYLSDVPENEFTPPAPFGLEEFDDGDLAPPRVYTKDELLKYANHCREKGRRVVGGATPESAFTPSRCGRKGFTVLELHLYNMRHVQHHAAQMNMLLRQHLDHGSRWVSRARIKS